MKRLICAKEVETFAQQGQKDLLRQIVSRVRVLEAVLGDPVQVRSVLEVQLVDPFLFGSRQEITSSSVGLNSRSLYLSGPVGEFFQKNPKNEKKAAAGLVVLSQLLGSVV